MLAHADEISSFITFFVSCILIIAFPKRCMPLVIGDEEFTRASFLIKPTWRLVNFAY